MDREGGALPDIEVLVEAADRGLHPEIRRWSPTAARRDALREELAWWLETAARDLDYAREYRRHQPQSGAPAESFLDRWLAVGDDLMALAGPRYRDRDPQVPFVGVVATSRPVVAADLPALRGWAREHFAVFRPGYVQIWAAAPVGAWPGVGNDARLLAAPLGSLRSRRSHPELSVRRQDDLSLYEWYTRLYSGHLKRSPPAWLQARPQSREDFAALVKEGTVLAVEVDGHQAGIVAARTGVASGLRGACVIELMLDDAFRGRGYGQHLSLALARNVPNADEEFLFGTIHSENTRAYRSALGAGRVDVGGEVIVGVSGAGRSGI